MDAAGKILTAITQEGSMSEAAVCSQQLDRIYGPLREQVAQSLKRQDTVLRQLKVALTYCLISVVFSTGVPRNLRLKTHGVRKSKPTFGTCVVRKRLRFSIPKIDSDLTEQASGNC